MTMIKAIAKRLGYAPIERRSYTDAILQYQLRSAQGLVAGISAAEEIAASTIGKAFASADVQGDPRLDTEVMLQIGRDLMLNGESVWRIAGDLEWQKNYDLRGGMYGFDGVRVSGVNVLHCRYAWDRLTGRGQSALDGCAGLRELVRQAQYGLELESRADVGYLVPSPGDADSSAGLQSDIETLKGQISVIETGQGGHGDPQSKADYKQMRFGFAPDATAVQMFLHATNLALVTMGIPTELAFERSDGTATREAWRRCLHGTVQPLGRLVESAASRVGMNASVSFDALMASDISGRAPLVRS